MHEEADRRFWAHFNQIVQELENPPYSQDPFYRNLDDVYQEPIALVETALASIRELTKSLKSTPIVKCEPAIQRLVLLVLFYVDKFGRNTRVTAGEIKGTQPVDQSRSQVDRLKQLVEEKGHDYNSGNISILSYFIWAEKSIVHEIHKRATRLLSLNKAPDHTAKFEDAPSTAFDLCAYAIFLIAYMRTFPGEDLKESASFIDNRIKESKGFDVQLATLCYLRRDGRTLMLQRLSESQGGQRTTYNALGGKVESGESPRACAIREVKEESGLIVQKIAFKGMVTITGVSRPDLASRDWYVLIYEVTDWTGDVTDGGPEGIPVWVEDSSLHEISFNSGDQYFLEHLRQPGWFEGSLRYTGSNLTHAEFQHYS
jgi:8-oxo-dGTP diphosphatase